MYGREMVAERFWHPHYHRFADASWHWEVHVPNEKLQARGASESSDPEFLYLYHFVVLLEKTEELCLAMGQVKGLWPSTQHCFFHGVCGRGTIQILMNPIHQ